MMKPHVVSLINALILMALSAWGYLASDTPSFTALIPAIIGLALLVCFPGVKAENKIISHIAVLLTLLILIGLVMPLRGALGREDDMALIRVIVMMLSTVWALAAFIKSFIDARKNRS